MDIIISEGVKIVFTSAGNPKLWTKKLQDNGVKVAHVVSSSKFALKCEEAGVDAVVAEASKPEDITGAKKPRQWYLYRR